MNIDKNNDKNNRTAAYCSSYFHYAKVDVIIERIERWLYEIAYILDEGGKKKIKDDVLLLQIISILMQFSAKFFFHKSITFGSEGVNAESYKKYNA